MRWLRPSVIPIAGGRFWLETGAENRQVMISYIKGKVLNKKPGEVVIEANGLGFSLQIPLSTYFKLGEAGSQVELLAYTHLTENALSLFGFSSQEEKIFS